MDASAQRVSTHPRYDTVLVCSDEIEKFRAYQRNCVQPGSSTCASMAPAHVEKASSNSDVDLIAEFEQGNLRKGWISMRSGRSEDDRDGRAQATQ